MWLRIRMPVFCILEAAVADIFFNHNCPSLYPDACSLDPRVYCKSLVLGPVIHLILASCTLQSPLNPSTLPFYYSLWGYPLALSAFTLVLYVYPLRHLRCCVSLLWHRSSFFPTLKDMPNLPRPCFHYSPHSLCSHHKYISDKLLPLLGSDHCNNYAIS